VLTSINDEIGAVFTQSRAPDSSPNSLPYGRRPPWRTPEPRSPTHLSPAAGRAPRMMSRSRWLRNAARIETRTKARTERAWCCCDQTNGHNEFFALAALIKGGDGSFRAASQLRLGATSRRCRAPTTAVSQARCARKAAGLAFRLAGLRSKWRSCRTYCAA
jgi:hypothetical protein